MEVVFSERAFASVMVETAEKAGMETGGLFLGKIVDGVWYIIEAIDPGPDSIFQVAYFEYDQKYTQHLINKIANLYESKLELIGLWHRHPGSMDYFSSTDDGTNEKYASMRVEGAVSGLVNIDPEFRFTMYHVEYPHRYSKIQIQISDELIPNDYKKLKSRQTLVKMMSMNKDDLISVSLNSFMDKIISAMKGDIYRNTIEAPINDENLVRTKIIDAVIDDLIFMTEQIGIIVSVVQKGYYVAFVQTTSYGQEQIIFMYDEKEQRIVFNYENQNYKYESGIFARVTNEMLLGINRKIIQFPKK